MRRAWSVPWCLPALALAGFVAAPREASAWTRATPTRWDPAVLPVRYRVNRATIPSTVSEAGGAGALLAIGGGFGAWAAAPCTAWRVVDDGDMAATPSPGDGRNVVLWHGDRWPPELGAESVTIGVTDHAWRTPGYIVDADVRFNAVGFRWDLRGSAGSVDVQSLVAHEAGHFLGLGHTPVGTAVMADTYAGGQRRALDPDDVAGVCALYPAGAGRACSADGQCFAGEQCVEGRCRVAPPDGGGTGAACRAPLDCLTGACLHTPSGNFCTQLCADDCTCPEGFACVTPRASSRRVCVPGANACAADAGARRGGRFEGGCGCSAPGARASGGGARLAAALAALAALGRARRARR